MLFENKNENTLFLFVLELLVLYNVLEKTFKVLFSLDMDNKQAKGEYREVLLRSPKTVFK